MNDFSIGTKGRRLFTHIKRHRHDIEGENNFDCLEDYGMPERACVTTALRKILLRQIPRQIPFSSAVAWPSGLHLASHCLAPRFCMRSSFVGSLCGVDVVCQCNLVFA